MTKDTPNGRIIAHCPISPEMEAAADQCFKAYKALNKKLEKFYATLPEGFTVKNFYGSGSLVIIDNLKEMEEQAQRRADEA